VLIVGLLSPQVDLVYVMFAKMREEKLGIVHLHDHPKRRNSWGHAIHVESMRIWLTVLVAPEPSVKTVFSKLQGDQQRVFGFA